MQSTWFKRNKKHHVTPGTLFVSLFTLPLTIPTLGLLTGLTKLDMKIKRESEGEKEISHSFLERFIWINSMLWEEKKSSLPSSTFSLLSFSATNTYSHLILLLILMCYSLEKRSVRSDVNLLYDHHFFPLSLSFFPVCIFKSRSLDVLTLIKVLLLTF